MMRLRLPNLAHRFAEDRRGTVATLFSLSMIPLTLMIGAGVDYGRALNAGNVTQNAIDAAALAAISEASGARAAKATNVFNATAQNHGLTVASTTFTENADGSFSASATVSVATTIMSSIVPSISVTRSAKAALGSGSVAQTAVGYPTCILLLDASMQHAFSSRSNSSLDASTCDVRVNSSGTGSRNTLDHWEDSDQSNKAAIFVSDSNFKFGSFCALGAIQGSVPGVSSTSCASTTDPFIGKLPTVTPGTCNAANTYSNGTISGPTPGGTFCGTFTFTGTIPAGIYYIRTADNATSSKLTLGTGVQGSGVTFYFVDENAALDVMGNSTKLSAPTSGPYAGYLVFMPSNLPKHNISIASLDKNNWSGVVYTPSWNVEIHSWSQDTLASICWVANSMVWDSESQVKVTPGPISILRYPDGSVKLSTEAAPTTTSTNTTPRLIN